MNINKDKYKRQATNLLFWLIIFLSFGVNGYSQVGVGTNAPNSKAAMDISSTNKGLLIPRITKANRPVTPPAGMMIYQTDNTPGFYFYTGAKWQRIYAVDETTPPTNNPDPGATTDPGTTPGQLGSVKGADSINYETVRLGDQSVWLRQNLGSTRVANSMTDAQSYGDLYQWGRWTDGHEKRIPLFSRTITTSNPNPNNPAGLVKAWGSNVNPYYYGEDYQWWAGHGTNATWTQSKPDLISPTNSCDPCKLLLGSTWRLPTLSEFNNLLNNSSMTLVSITNLETAYQSWLRFSTSGFRDAYTTGLFEIGQAGYFWTSKIGTGGYGHFGAYCFGLQKERDGYTDAFTSNSNTGYGFSIRCKKD